MYTNVRGFTLIELLVVIAIIGILASVVLASLNSARDKGADSAIKSNLNNIRSQAELFFSDYGRYGSATWSHYGSQACPVSPSAGLLFENQTIYNAVESARTASGGTYSEVTRCAVGVGAMTYAISVRLKSSSSWWCIDSSGVAKEISSSTPNLGGGSSLSAQCPGS